jgi:hypothetical protein
MALLTTAEVAAEVKMSEDWVRDHAEELGGIRMGVSKHSQLRFEPRSIREWKERRRLATRSGGRITSATSQPPRRRGRSIATPLLELPLRGG